MNTPANQKNILLTKDVYDDLIVACDAALDKFTNYFDISSDLAVLATILDPRLKLVYYEDGPHGFIFFKILIVLFLGETIEDKTTRVNHHRQIFESAYNDEYRPIQQLATVQRLSDDEEDNFLPFFKKTRIEVNIKNEVEIYFSFPCANYDVEPLGWWVAHKAELPTLCKMAMDVLSIQSTSVASERAFSGGRQTITDFRCQLSNDSVRELQCLKSWYRFFD